MVHIKLSFSAYTATCLRNKQLVGALYYLVCSAHNYYREHHYRRGAKLDIELAHA